MPALQVPHIFQGKTRQKSVSIYHSRHTRAPFSSRRALGLSPLIPTCDCQEGDQGCRLGGRRPGRRHGYDEAPGHIPARGISITSERTALSSAAAVTDLRAQGHHRSRASQWDQRRVRPTRTKPAGTLPEASGDLMGKSLKKGKPRRHGQPTAAVHL